MRNLSRTAAVALLTTVLAATALGGPTADAGSAAPDAPLLLSGDGGPSIELVSVKADGTLPVRRSWGASVSSDGRYVGFLSRAAGLDPAAGRPRGNVHVYVRDLVTGTTSAVDVGPDGTFGGGTANTFEKAGSSFRPSFSADGRLVVFASTSRGLAPGGRSATLDVFMRDMVAKTTILVSVTAGGGRANADSYDAEISGDGTTIVFRSLATNILPGQQRVGEAHIYRRDLATGIVTLVSTTPTGEFSVGHSYDPSISADGDRIAYETLANDIVPSGDEVYIVVLYDHETGTSELVSRTQRDSLHNGSSTSAAISADGTTVVFGSTADNLLEGDDPNQLSDVFSYGVATHDVTLTSHGVDGDPADGESGHPDVSADGDITVYSSEAANVADRVQRKWDDVFRHDADGDTTSLASQGIGGARADQDSEFPAVSADGSVVAFESRASNLVPGMTSNHLRIYVSAGR